MDTIKFKLTVAYDGAAYEGWQVQKTGTGVQEKIEEALAKLFPSRPRVHGSSRTDTGVHALGLVAHFEIPRTEATMTPAKLLLALNAWLPEDVRVMAAGRCRATFHARFDASGKQYRYQVWNHAAMNPLLRDRAWHVPRPLDLAAMRRAARHFEGRHDFRSFRANPDYDSAHTVRTLTCCRITRSGALITFTIEGDESACELNDLLKLIQMDAIDGFFLKVPKAGGLLKSQKWVGIAEAADLIVMCGCMINSGLGAAVEAHFLAATQWMGLIEQESIGPLNLYNRLDTVNPPLKDDLAKVGVRYEAGYLYPPQGPGLGVELNEEIIPSIITPGKNPTVVS